MRAREEILQEVQAGLESGVITEADLSLFITATPAPAPAPPALAQVVEEGDNKLSAVDVMFYVAGFVLFAAILSIIVQSWSDGNPLTHILLSAGVGMLLWSVAYFLITGNSQSDTRKGLVNSLLLTGSLSIIAGGYIITNHVVGGFGEVNFVPAAFMLLVVGLMHVGLDRLIRHDLTLLIGVFLAVASFPALLFGILQDTEVSAEIWAGVFIATTLLLVAAARMVAKISPGRTNLATAFDSLAAFLSLLTMYSWSFGDYGVLWLCLLIGSIFGIFYLSIVAQNKHLLGNGSFFLVLTVITVSFKYFSGYGVTASLVIATLGLLGTAAVAASINRKYFKQPQKQAVAVPQPEVQGQQQANEGEQ